MKILKYFTVVLSALLFSAYALAGTLVINSNQSGESSKAAFNYTCSSSISCSRVYIYLE